MGNLLYRLVRPIPLLGDLVFLANHNHEPTVNPDEPSVFLKLQYFKSHRTGLWVHYRVWAPAGPPRATIYLMHGYAEHCGRYEHVASNFAKAGYRVVALDHQGSGRSEGTPGYVVKFRHFIDDALQLIREVVPTQEGQPRILMGHSMGGLIALHVANASQDLWQGLILSGPGLVFDPKVDNAVNRCLASSLSAILPKLPVQKLDVETLCTDPVVVRAYTRDPLVYHGPLRVRFGHEMMKAVKEVHAWAGDLSLPLLVVHGANDILCNPKGSEWLMSAAVKCTDKTLKMYPGLKHEILNEPNADEIMSDITSWIAKHA
jgi:alpha-beta hydrolase superfamily lysophospholipase